MLSWLLFAHFSVFSPPGKISPGLPTFAPGQDSGSLPISGPQEVKWRPGANDVGRAVVRVPTRMSGPTARLRTPLTSSPQCREIANNHRELRRLGISHVLNASHSRWRGTPEAYEGLGIRYLGVEAHDSPAFDMSVHFQAAADFIHRALSQPGGRILVHCAVGVSRSATLVLAYLMLYHRLTLVEAIKKVKDHRGIIPNRGFLRQLLALDRRLRQRLEA
ncbi:dual specificity protein phosphatase 26 isoform X1 [Eubalaena glacialis]|uniref:dual specificity protein phosphatase 26 isoform X1 n=1 Tax=Eubalaena glacialis TaxID=27606 RepID=UPI002A5A2209|nr:dual specificity protein phosphatase 26 isoform X1 [Eubalaena glacialis]